MSLHRIGGFTICLSALSLAFAGCNKASNNSQSDAQVQQTCSAEVEGLAIQLDEDLLNLKRLKEAQGPVQGHSRSMRRSRMVRIAAQKADSRCEILFEKMKITPSCTTLGQVQGQSITISTNNFVDDCNMAHEIGTGKN